MRWANSWYLRNALVIRPRRKTRMENPSTQPTAQWLWCSGTTSPRSTNGCQRLFDGDGVALVEQPAVTVVGVDDGPVLCVLDFVLPCQQKQSNSCQFPAASLAAPSSPFRRVHDSSPVVELTPTYSVSEEGGAAATSHRPTNTGESLRQNLFRVPALRCGRSSG